MLSPRFLRQFREIVGVGIAAGLSHAIVAVLQRRSGRFFRRIKSRKPPTAAHLAVDFRSGDRRIEAALCVPNGLPVVPGIATLEYENSFRPACFLGSPD